MRNYRATYTIHLEVVRFSAEALWVSAEIADDEPNRSNSQHWPDSRAQTVISAHAGPTGGNRPHPAGKQLEG